MEEVTFLTDRQTRKVNIDFTTSQPLAKDEQLTAIPFSDFRRTDKAGSWPDDHIRVGADVFKFDHNIARLRLCLNPEGVHPGEYQGTFRINGERVQPFLLTVTATIQHQKAFLAFVILVLGLVAGYLLKWYTDTGRRLTSVSRHGKLLDRRLEGYDPHDLPESFRADRARLEQQIQDFNALDAAALLEQMAPSLGGLVEAADRVRQARARVAGQRTVMAAKTLPAWLARIPDTEDDLLNEILSRCWPDPTAIHDELTALLADISRVSTIFELIDKDPKPFDVALMLFSLQEVDQFRSTITDLVKDHPEALQSVLASAPKAPRVTPPPDHATPAAPPRIPSGLRLPRSWREFLGLGIGALTVIVLAMVGLKSQYLNNAVFGGSGLTDWFVLFLWGIGAQVTGTTVAQFVGQATSTGR